MPGACKSSFVLVFDLARSVRAIPVLTPKQAADETTAIVEARRLADIHAGAIACKREAQSVISEEVEPKTLWEAGTLGDFN